MPHQAPIQGQRLYEQGQLSLDQMRVDKIRDQSKREKKP